ncbi:MAG: PrgI family protein [Candidatus Pacebacteria bacterium]|nr:PrgI family protein [Candidatus Paceibacterota bacterium]
MEFRVPQFIDVQDKIFGQFTFIQVVYLAGGASISYVLWQSMPLIIGLPLIVGILTLSLALAFYPEERYGRPFVAIMESALRFYLIDTKLYTWKQVPKIPKKDSGQKVKNTLSVSVPNISDSNLKDLTWGLGVKKEIS